MGVSWGRSTRGAAPATDKAALFALLIYGYSALSCRIQDCERATCDSLAFGDIARKRHPDQDTPTTFRRRFRKALEAFSLAVLEVARASRLYR